MREARNRFRATHGRTPFPHRGIPRAKCPTLEKTEVTTKNELIAAIAEKTGKSKSDVGAILAAAGEIVTAHLKSGQEVVLGDIAKLKIARREAREARSPATGQTVQVAAKNVVKFKPVKSLADAVA